MRRVRAGLSVLALVWGLVAPGSVAVAASDTTRATVLAAGLQPMPAETGCLKARSKRVGSNAAFVSSDALLDCFPQEVLAQHVVNKAVVGLTDSVRSCVLLALQSAPWPTFIDLYRAFAVVPGAAYTTSNAFQGRINPFTRPCRALPADAEPALFPVVPGLVLGDLTARWNAAAARRTVAGFAPITTWQSVPNGPLATGPVSTTATFVALPSSSSTPAPGAAQSDITLAGAALTLRPVPDVARATAAIDVFVETVDSSGRAASVVASLDLARLLKPGAAPKRISVGNLVYTALVSAPAGEVAAFQITAVING